MRAAQVIRLLGYWSCPSCHQPGNPTILGRLSCLQAPFIRFGMKGALDQPTLQWLKCCETHMRSIIGAHFHQFLLQNLSNKSQEEAVSIHWVAQAQPHLVLCWVQAHPAQREGWPLHHTSRQSLTDLLLCCLQSLARQQPQAGKAARLPAGRPGIFGLASTTYGETRPNVDDRHLRMVLMQT